MDEKEEKRELLRTLDIDPNNYQNIVDNVPIKDLEVLSEQFIDIQNTQLDDNAKSILKVFSIICTMAKVVGDKINEE